MRITAFLWHEGNTAHIAEHGVSPAEVEEALGRAPSVRRSRFDRYVAIGPTEGGRLLVVVFLQFKRGVVRVITARDATSKEKRAYGRK